MIPRKIQIPGCTVSPRLQPGNNLYGQGDRRYKILGAEIPAGGIVISFKVIAHHPLHHADTEDPVKIEESGQQNPGEDSSGQQHSQNGKDVKYQEQQQKYAQPLERCFCQFAAEKPMGSRHSEKSQGQSSPVGDHSHQAASQEAAEKQPFPANRETVIKIHLLSGLQIGKSVTAAATAANIQPRRTRKFPPPNILSAISICVWRSHFRSSAAWTGFPYSQGGQLHLQSKWEQKQGSRQDHKNQPASAPDIFRQQLKI